MSRSYLYELLLGRVVNVKSKINSRARCGQAARSSCNDAMQSHYVVEVMWGV